MADTDLKITPVSGKADLKAFVDLPWAIYADDPHWVAPLKFEAYALLDPRKNPWFEHGEAQYFLARRNGSVTGRISAHIDHLAIAMDPVQGMGPGTGNWGLLEAKDAASAQALIGVAEDWLRGRGMHRALGPLSISIWDEPGLLIKGHDHPPTVMMGHNRPEYQGWIEALGYRAAKQLFTYDVKIDEGFPPIVQRIVSSGEKNSRIVIRRVNKKQFDVEAALIMSILNEAWSGNWGFVPLTPAEISFVGKKLRPLVFEDLIRIAEVDGEPVAFMITLPDFNEVLKPLKGSLYLFGWARLLLWLAAPKARTMRVPLMGVVQRLQGTRMASQLAFMMIEFIRRDAVAKFGTTRGEFGWVLDDNQGMNAIAKALEAPVNKIYQIYDRDL